MKLLNLQQGTQEWLDSRLSHFTASDAPAVMGASKYKTRKQLLDEKSGAPTEVITPAKQKLFDKGHKAEDDARNVLAVEEMDDYLPCVGVCSYFPGTAPYCDPLPLMASFDGRSDSKDHLFEHKLWNETLAANVRNGVLEPSHYWQLEHQLLVDEKAGYVLFVVSDGTAQKREMMKYYSIPERREELIAAWALFKSDLESHQIEAKQELIIAEQNNFPVLSCKVTGTEITTNIAQCLIEIKNIAKEELNRPFETDQDFADKDQLNKDVKKLRAELKDRVASVKGAFISYSEFESVAVDMDEVLQKMQSAGEKQVKQAKENKKLALQGEAIESLNAHVIDCNNRTGAPFSIEQVVLIKPDWLAAMKNKRTFESLKSSLDTVLNDWKVKLTQATDLIAPNFKFLEENADEYKFLFQDVFTLINQPEESFKAIVTTRINDHKQVEADKLAKETARIQKEADDAAAKKLEDDAEAIRQGERDKIKAEQKVTAEHEEAIKINAEFDEYKANQAKQKSTPPAQLHSQKQSATYPVKGTDPDFKGVGNKQVRSQTMRNDEAVKVQSAHNPLPVDFLTWQQGHKINSVAFLELEQLINKHFVK